MYSLKARPKSGPLLAKPSRHKQGSPGHQVYKAGHPFLLLTFKHEHESESRLELELNKPHLLQIFNLLLSHNALLLLDHPLANAAGGHPPPVPVRALPLQPPDLPDHLALAPPSQFQPTPGQPCHRITPLDQPAGVLKSLGSVSKI